MIYCKECPACSERGKRGLLKPLYPPFQPHPIVKLAAIHCTNCGRYYIADKKINCIRVAGFLTIFSLFYFTDLFELVFPGILFLTGELIRSVTRWIYMFLAVFLDFEVCIRFKWTEASELDAKVQENRGINTWGPVVFVIVASNVIPLIISAFLDLLF